MLWMGHRPELLCCPVSYSNSLAVWPHLCCLQLQRLMLRDGSSAADAQARIDAQLPLATKEQLADVVLHNDSDIQQLQAQVRRHHMIRNNGKVPSAFPSSMSCTVCTALAAAHWLVQRAFACTTRPSCMCTQQLTQVPPEKIVQLNAHIVSNQVCSLPLQLSGAA